MRYIFKHHIYNVPHPTTGAVIPVWQSAGRYINPKRQEKKRNERSTV